MGCRVVEKWGVNGWGEGVCVMKWDGLQLFFSRGCSHTPTHFRSIEGS